MKTNYLDDKGLKTVIKNLYPIANYFTSAPVGSIIAYMGNEAPQYHLKCDGSIYNIKDYQLLADHFKKQFGAINHFGGDGTTTFAVPDLQGEFLRGTGTNGHAEQGSGADVGVHQDATNIPNVLAAGGALSGRGWVGGFVQDGVQGATNKDSETGVNADHFVYSGNSQSEGTHKVAYTSRPTNTSVLYCIKYNNVNEDIRQIARGLQFDPNNRKGLIWKRGATYKFYDDNDNLIERVVAVDTKLDFTDVGLVNGADYTVEASIDALENITFTATPSALANPKKAVGWFHTLGTSVSDDQTSIYKCATGQTVIDLVPAYKNSVECKAHDEFYNNKPVLLHHTAQSGSYYQTCEVKHALAGFEAGSILPESVWCQTFRPTNCKPDGMAYEPASKRAIDIYVMSNSSTTEDVKCVSKFNAVPCRSLKYDVMLKMLNSVGKEMLSEHEFTQMSWGSPQNVSVHTGSNTYSDNYVLHTGVEKTKNNYGTYASQANKRLISTLGFEDACGYLWHVLRDCGGLYNNGNIPTYKTRMGDPASRFGGYWYDTYQITAGACYIDASNYGSFACGSFARSFSNFRADSYVYISSRGSCLVGSSEM